MSSYSGLRCAVGKSKGCKRDNVRHFCHHCGKPLCGNRMEHDRFASEMRKKTPEVPCCVRIHDPEFPSMLNEDGKPAGNSPAFHCPDCAVKFHPIERKGCLGFLYR